MCWKPECKERERKRLEEARKAKEKAAKVMISRMKKSGPAQLEPDGSFFMPKVPKLS